MASAFQQAQSNLRNFVNKLKKQAGGAVRQITAQQPVNSIGQSRPNIPQQRPIQVNSLGQSRPNIPVGRANLTGITQTRPYKLLVEPQVPALTPLLKGDVRGYKKTFSQANIQREQAIKRRDPEHAFQLAMGTIGGPASPATKFGRELNKTKIAKKNEDFSRGLQIERGLNNNLLGDKLNEGIKFKELVTPEGIKKLLRDETGAIRLDLGLTGNQAKSSAKISSKPIIPQAKPAVERILEHYKSFPKSVDLDAVKADFKNNPTALRAIKKAQEDVRIATIKSQELSKRGEVIRSKFRTAQTVGDIRRAEEELRQLNLSQQPVEELMSVDDIRAIPETAWTNANVGYANQIKRKIAEGPPQAKPAVAKQPISEVGVRFAKPEQISDMGRVKTAEIDNVFKNIPDGTTEPKGFIVKRGDKLYPTEKFTPEALKKSMIELNPDGSIKEGFNYNKMTFTEDAVFGEKNYLVNPLNPPLSQQPAKTVGGGLSELEIIQGRDFLNKLPVDELRRRQRLVEKQIQMGLRGKSENGLNRLQDMQRQLDQVILEKEFGIQQPASVKTALPQELAQQTDQSVSQLVPEAKQIPEVQAPKSQTSPAQGGGQPNVPGGLSSAGSLPDDASLIKQLTQALKEAKPIRGKQEAIYTKARGQKMARMMSARQGVAGEKGFFAEKGALKGELPKIEYENIRKQFNQEGVDRLFDIVRQSKNLDDWDKLTAEEGLAKILGEFGGTVPTRGEIEKMYKVFGREFTEALLSKRSLFTKLGEAGLQAYNIPRSLMTGFGDFSATLMQNLVFAYRHPIMTSKNFTKQLGMFRSEKVFNASQEEIFQRPTYKLMKEAKLAITDVGPMLGNREEQYMVPVLEKIPGLGRPVKATGRAYTGFLNRMRADVFDQLVRSQKVMGGDIHDPEFLKWAGKFVNAGTGRGGLGPLEKSGSLLAQVFFSGRKLAATFQMLDPRMYTVAPAAVRKEALKTAFAFVGGASAITATASFAGADVSTDPTSADFAKIKVGNTRFNLFGPYQQLAVLLARLYKGYGTSSTTGKKFTLGEGYKPVTRLDLVTRFFENKEHPTLSLIAGGIRGQNEIGQDFDLPREVLQRFMPMLVADAYSLFQEHGAKGLLGTIPTALGVPAQTYGGQELVEGTDRFGQPGTQIKPKGELHDLIIDKTLGPKPIGNSAGSSVEVYYDQLLKLPQEQAAAEFDKIAKTNPDLAKKIVRVVKDRQMGVTNDDYAIKGLGVSSGDRAYSVAEEFNKLKTQEEKAMLWERYVKLKIINKDVAKQLKVLKERGELK